MSSSLPSYCPHCGTRITRGGGETCLICGGALTPKGGILGRVLSWLLGRRFAAVDVVSRIRTETRTESQEFHVSDSETGEVKVYHSVEELPPEVRQRVEVFRSQPQSQVRHKYKFRDGSGVERTYGSLEEMPPEVRRFFERSTTRTRRAE